MDTTILSGSDDTTILYPEEKIVEALLTQALITVKRGDYETAIVELNKVIDHGTGNLKLLGDIYMWYGKVCQHVKDFKLAMDFFEKELALKQLTGDHVAACDVLQRITKLQMHMGNHSKARRTAESLLEYAADKSEHDVEAARVLLVMACLAGAHDARKPEEKSALLAQARESISASFCASPSKNEELQALLLEARWHALQKSSESQQIYKKCIEKSREVEDFEILHRALYESTISRESNPAVSINDLRSAIFYAESCGAQIDAADYKIVLSKLLLQHGSAHEAYSLCKSALATARKEDATLIEPALFAMVACLNALGRRRQAAYFVVLGSVLTVEKNIESFYKLMDEMMEQQKTESQELAIDASEDAVPNEAAAKFVVKLEHTTNVETWRSVIKELLESATKKKTKAVKDDEPLDFMELICQMSRQFDDQRCELQPLPYQRPLSAASSTGTNKSHKKFPGLRTALIRMKDKHIVARLLRSKKSSASMAHDTTISSHTTTSSTASR